MLVYLIIRLNRAMVDVNISAYAGRSSTNILYGAKPIPVSEVKRGSNG